jgi:hypothetical protein
VSLELILAAVVGVVTLIVGAFMRGSKAGRDGAAAEAARRRSEAEKRGNAAAADAGRDGAAERLRRGDF